MLFESGKAAGERVAPCVDDLRVRQDEADETDMGDISYSKVDRKSSGVVDQLPLQSELVRCL